MSWNTISSFFLLLSRLRHENEIRDILGLEVHVLYMSKRKPKLCRMKRLNVSSKTHFSFY